MKFTKWYYGSDFRSLLQLYMRDRLNPEWRDRSYQDTRTGAHAVVLK